MRTTRGNRWQLCSFCLSWPVCIGVAFAASTSAADSNVATEHDAHTTAKRLVDEARVAGLSRSSGRQFALLREAIRIAPDYELPRWQLGQVRVDGRWMAIEEAQHRAAADPKQARYRELRQVHGETPDGQLALARWTRKNNLDDEARFHWASVLSVDPTNEEALRALDLQWIDGRAMTRADAAEAKQRFRDAKRAASRWAPTIAKWRKAVTGDDAAARETALAEIRSLTDAEAIPALEEISFGRDAVDRDLAEAAGQISLAFVDGLNTIPDYAATESLARHAVFSPTPAVRAAAVEHLVKRPLHDYVPLLLSGLAMPIESSFSVITDAFGCVHYRHSLYREGQDADWAFDTRLTAMQHLLPGRKYLGRRRTGKIEVDITESDASRAIRMASVARRNGMRFGQEAAVLESQVWTSNQATQASNAKIMPVLAAATGKDFIDAKDWWKWWQENNEYYVYDERPVYQEYRTDTSHYYHGQPYDTVQWLPSCFAAGTPVWTKIGQRPIETLELGDLVLAQDVDTGELTFKPVIGRTVRPPSPILKICSGGEELLTTRGHPFWVADIGWRMAKELRDGALLHGITGTTHVDAIESASEAEAYNFVVADFNTYFVGASGVLVHDNTPRRPTRATVPGLVGRNAQ